jgi:hypothetical protein
MGQAGRFFEMDEAGGHCGDVLFPNKRSREGREWGDDSNAEPHVTQNLDYADWMDFQDLIHSNILDRHCEEHSATRMIAHAKGAERDEAIRCFNKGLLRRIFLPSVEKSSSQ